MVLGMGRPGQRPRTVRGASTRSAARQLSAVGPGPHGSRGRLGSREGGGCRPTASGHEPAGRLACAPALRPQRSDERRHSVETCSSSRTPPLPTPSIRATVEFDLGVTVPEARFLPGRPPRWRSPSPRRSNLRLPGKEMLFPLHPVPGLLYAAVNSTRRGSPSSPEQASQSRCLFASRRDCRAASLADASRSGMFTPVPKYISSGVCPWKAECGISRLCEAT